VVTSTACKNTSEKRNRGLLGNCNRVLCLKNRILTLLAEFVVLGNCVGSTTDLEGTSLLSVLEHEINRGFLSTRKTVVVVHHTRVVRRTINKSLVSGVVTLESVVSVLDTLKSHVISAFVATKLRNKLDGLYTLWQLLLKRNCGCRRAHGGAGESREFLPGLGEAFELLSDGRITIKIFEGSDTRNLFDFVGNFLDDFSARSIRLEVENDILTMVDNIECELVCVQVVLGKSLIDKSFLHGVVFHADDEGNDLTIDFEGLLELKIKHMSIDKTTNDDWVNDGVVSRNCNSL
jgi:hypothetical protein